MNDEKSRKKRITISFSGDEAELLESLGWWDNRRMEKIIIDCLSEDWIPAKKEIRGWEDYEGGDDPYNRDRDNP